MDMIVNDLSFEAQFHEIKAFQDSISRLMMLRSAATRFGSTVYCHRNLLEIEVMPDVKMRRALQLLPLSHRRALQQWLTQHGPFWEDDRIHGEGDYLALEDGSIVTDTAIGEAGFGRLNGYERSLVSLAPSSWEFSPIPVVWHHNDIVSQETAITNFWTEQRLIDALAAVPPNFATWEELAEACRQRFTHVDFAMTAFSYLRGFPFNRATAERIMSRMQVLDELKSCFDDAGNRTSKGFEIIEQHFSRDGARFSDSSETEKSEFRSKLTFAHPYEENSSMFCPWHAKVNGTPPMRIHFSWPIRADEPFFVVYVGAKRTRR